MKKLIFVIALLFATSAFAQVSVNTVSTDPYLAQRLTFYNEDGTAVTALGTVSGATIATDTIVSSWFDIFAYDSVSFSMWTTPGDTGYFKIGIQYGCDADTGKSYYTDAVNKTVILDSILTAQPNTALGRTPGAFESISVGRAAGGTLPGAVFARIILVPYIGANAAHYLALHGTAGNDATKLNNNTLRRRIVNK